MALPVGVLTAIFVSEFAPRRIGEQVRLWLDVLNGFPSIVIGIFVFALVRQGEPADRRLGPPPERVRRRLRARDHHAAARRARDDGGARARAERASARRATRSASRSGRPCCGSCCRRRSAASSPARRSRSRAPPARRRRCSSRASLAGQTVDWNPTHSVELDPVHDLPVLGGARPDCTQQAWALAFVLIAFVLVDEPDRAVPARALAAASSARRADASLLAFTTPSPAGHTASAHAGDPRHAGASVWTP